MKYDAIIFDFDYTLADSSEGAIECIQYAFDHMNIPSVSSRTSCETIGLSLTDTFIRLTDKKLHSQETIQTFQELFIRRADEVMAEKTFLFELVRTEIVKFKNKDIKLGIVSTKFRYRIESILSREGMLNHFDIIVGGEDVKENKPNPVGLLTTINKISTHKKEVLYVGDSITDCMTAKNAGVEFVAVTTGTTSRQEFLELGVEKIIKNLSELHTILR